MKKLTTLVCLMVVSFSLSGCLGLSQQVQHLGQRMQIGMEEIQNNRTKINEHENRLSQLENKEPELLDEKIKDVDPAKSSILPRILQSVGKLGSGLVSLLPPPFNVIIGAGLMILLGRKPE